MIEIKEMEEILKLGIETHNIEWNRLIYRLADLAMRNSAPLLLCGACGTGKTTLIRKYYECKVKLGQVKGPLKEVNCSIFNEEEALIAIFGIEKDGKFTPGAMAEAENGMLFLDRADFLSNEGRRRFLEAIETGKYFPINSKQEKSCNFILASSVSTENQFYDAEETEFFSRIGLWRFTLPSLCERLEDIENNINYELDKHRKKPNDKLFFIPDAFNDYIDFATSPKALWSGNFRDLIQSVQRMVFLSKKGCIDLSIVHEEKQRLLARWNLLQQNYDEEDSKKIKASVNTDKSNSLNKTELKIITSSDTSLENISPQVNNLIRNCDEFDRLQLLSILKVCRESDSIAAAGRRLFAKSRLERQSINDSDRLRKYLDKFGLTWEMVKG